MCQRGSILDAVFEFGKLQGAGGILHPLFLVPSNDRRYCIGWYVFRFKTIEPEQGSADGNAVCAQLSGGGFERRDLCTNCAYLISEGCQGDSALVHRVTAYNKSALWDSVKGWFEGAQIQIAQSISRVQAFTPSIVRADLPGGSILPIPRKKRRRPWRGIHLPTLLHLMNTPMDIAGIRRWLQRQSPRMVRPW